MAIDDIVRKMSGAKDEATTSAKKMNNPPRTGTRTGYAARHGADSARGSLGQIGGTLAAYGGVGQGLIGMATSPIALLVFGYVAYKKFL